MRSSVEKVMMVGFGIVVTITIFLIIGSSCVTARHRELAYAVSHTHEVREEIAHTLQAITDTETRQRIYVLLGSDPDLQSYLVARAQVAPHIGRLTILTIDNPIQQRNLARLRQDVGKRLERLTETVHIRQALGLRSAYQHMQLGLGRKAMERVRWDIQAMDAEESRLLALRTTTFDTFLQVGNLLFNTLYGVALLSLGIVFVGVRRISHARQQSQRQIVKIWESITECFIFLDRDWRVVYINSEMEHLLQVDRHQFIGNVLWELLPHLVGTHVEKQHRRAMMEQVTLRCEYYSSRRDRWYEITSYPAEDGLSVYFRDITEQVRAREELRESKRFIESITQNSTSLLYVYDLDKRAISYINRDAGDFLGYSFEEAQALGDNFAASVAHPDDLPSLRANREAYAAMLDGDVLDYEARMRHGSGTYRWVWFRERIFKRHPDGTPAQIMGTAQDITDRRAAEQELQATKQWLERANEELIEQQALLLAVNAQLENLASTDGLTGLKNHRAFQEMLADEFRRSSRYQPPLSLILLDVDHFKQFNDTFGHPAGDEVLKTVARLLQETVRATDIVARYGGEEFAVILPETDAEGVYEAAERLRRVIAQHPWPNCPITASFGVSTFRLSISTPQQLVDAADRALYAGKTAGRNCVAHARSEERTAIPPAM